MSFNPFVPEGAIIARLKSHVALVTATQGIYNTIAIDDDGESITVGQGKKPFVVVTHVSGDFGESTFRKNVCDSLYQVSVYDSWLNGDDDAKTVIGYIFGDSRGTDNAPTYGLARWTLSASGMEDAMMETDEPRTAHTAEALHYFMTFRIKVTEA